MNEKTEEVKNAEDGWEQFDKDMAKGGNFLKLEVDKPYKVVISKAELIESDKFKDKEGKPKKQMELTIEKLNNEPCGKKWQTGSWSVMKEIRKAMKDGSLARSVFLVKKKQEGDKKSYVFEKLEELQAPAPTQGGRVEEKSAGAGGNPSPAKRDEIGAFVN